MINFSFNFSLNVWHRCHVTAKTEKFKFILLYGCVEYFDFIEFFEWKFYIMLVGLHMSAYQMKAHEFWFSVYEHLLVAFYLPLHNRVFITFDRIIEAISIFIRFFRHLELDGCLAYLMRFYFSIWIMVYTTITHRNPNFRILF